jgi:GntR family transcriptional repressor for pyruvate dehydrogenase complex
MLNDITSIQPMSKDLLYMKVADAIYNYIKVNKLQPGDKIPSERDLAERFQIGRNSVREALRVLQNEQIIEVKIGKGVFVTQSSNADSIYLKLIKVNYTELMDTRRILEKSVIEYVIENASESQIEKLESYLFDIEKDAAKNIFSREQDKLFHSYMFSIRNNRMLEQIVLNLINVLDNYGNALENANDIWVTTIPYHRQMFEAIKSRDKQAAFDAYDHIYQIDLMVLNTAQEIESHS